MFDPDKTAPLGGLALLSGPILQRAKQTVLIAYSKPNDLKFLISTSLSITASHGVNKFNCIGIWFDVFPNSKYVDYSDCEVVLSDQVINFSSSRIDDSSIRIHTVFSLVPIAQKGHFDLDFTLAVCISGR